MKLRNKKTGEIGDIAQTNNDAIIVYYPIVDGVATNPQHRGIYGSLAELNEEWEDYEEPKEEWYINEYGTVTKAENYGRYTIYDKSKKNFGNYFETKEEAERAVEKLKAWKRLKDKGFKFKGYTDDSGDLFSCQVIRCSFDDFGKESRKDLDLLFSQEDD